MDFQLVNSWQVILRAQAMSPPCGTEAAGSKNALSCYTSCSLCSQRMEKGTNLNY
jgi:hypothetical protein